MHFCFAFCGILVVVSGLEVNITKIIFLIAWINHLGGCMWYFWGKTSARNWHSFVSNSPSEPVTYEPEQYALFLYWSVTAMVSGASFMSPTSVQEWRAITPLQPMDAGQ
eukprot:4684351-Amphidinium_carterae.1